MNSTADPYVFSQYCSNREGRAMTTRTLCPKCHGQRTVACTVCSGSGGRCVARVVIGICAQCHGSMEAADVAVMFVAVQQKLNETHFNDWLPSTTQPDEPCAASARTGRRLLLGTS